jgi:uncharacterized membrane-anchored protein
LHNEYDWSPLPRALRARALLGADRRRRRRGQKEPEQHPAEAPAADAKPVDAKPAPASAADVKSSAPAPADDVKPVAPLDPKVAEVQASIDGGLAGATKGPAKVALIDQATLQIPPGEAFVPKAEGLRILRAFGNSPDENDMVGLVMGLAEDDSWIVVIRYIKEGYIKDDDAKSWNADDLLANLKSGTEEANKERAARGFPAAEVIGWIEKPTYDSERRRLVWSLSSQTKGANDEVKGVNYNTYALGRDGYFSLNMLTDSLHVESYKPLARTLLANLSYNTGKRYEDFNASTDQIAAYGLAALVGGVAAKKLGLLALGAAFVLKFAKLFLLGGAALVAGVVKFFKRDKSA